MFLVLEMYRQCSVKKPTSKKLQVKIPFRFYPFYLHYPHQPWLTLNVTNTVTLPLPIFWENQTTVYTVNGTRTVYVCAKLNKTYQKHVSRLRYLYSYINLNVFPVYHLQSPRYRALDPHCKSAVKLGCKFRFLAAPKMSHLLYLLLNDEGGAAWSSGHC